MDYDSTFRYIGSYVLHVAFKILPYSGKLWAKQRMGKKTLVNK